MTVPDDERIEKYEAHIRLLESELVDLETIRRRIRWVPLGLMTAPLGLIWGFWYAVSIAAGWIVLVMVTQYLNRVRRWWTRMELEDLRRELGRIRRGVVPRRPGRPS